MYWRGEFLIEIFKLLCNYFNSCCECGWQLTIECRRRFLSEGGLYCVESDCSTWNIVRENTPKNPEVMILANVILAPKSNFRLYVLDALRNRPKRQCRKLNTVHIMAISFITYQGYPKIPIRVSFKRLPLIKSRKSNRQRLNSLPLIKSLLK